MAQQQSIPGVFAYLSEGGPRLAESFTSGMNAGSRVKAQQSEDAKTKADQEYRTQRDTYNRGRDTTEDQFKRDAIARQDEMNKQGLMQRYGQDLKYAADGSVDLQSSENARNQRALDAQAAAAYGEQSGLGVEGPFPQNVMENPAYPVGAAKGMSEKVRLDNASKIAEDRNNERLLDALMRGSGGYGAEKTPPEITELNGVPGVSSNGRFTPLSDAALRAYKQSHKPQTNSAPGAIIRVTRGPNGEPIVTRQ
jgi:hypothetical protein